MRRSLSVILVTGAVLAPVTLAVPAQAAANPCTVRKMPKFDRVIDLKKDGAHLGTKKHPTGWLTGRYAKKVKSQYNDFYYRPYGRKHTVRFAKKRTICVLGFTAEGGLTMKKTSLAGLRKEVRNPRNNPQWGLKLNKWGKITLAYHLYHP